MYIEAPIHGPERPPEAHAGEQVAGHDLPSVLEQHAEKLEFHSGQGKNRIAPPDLARRHVQLEVVNHRRPPGPLTTATQHGTDPRQQFPSVERLG